MAVEDPSIAASILLSRATWAGDWAYADYLSQLAQQSTDVRGVPPMLFKIGSDAKAKTLSVATKKAAATRPEIIRGEDLYGQGIPTVAVLQGHHLRAVISQTSSVDFEVRAYLSDLTWHSQLHKTVRTMKLAFHPYREYRSG